jgi:F0F1-type ATP synthase membrane subunit b/b'
MEILLQLGANETAFIQFLLFVITISFLTIVVYNPFFKAYDERLKLTKGADQVANETQDEAKKLELIYQARAREINGKIQSAFDASRKQAAETSTTILTQAKEAATVATEQARAEIANQKQKAEQLVKIVSEEVASEITKKLTGAAL